MVLRGIITGPGSRSYSGRKPERPGTSLHSVISPLAKKLTALAGKISARLDAEIIVHVPHEISRLLNMVIGSQPDLIAEISRTPATEKALEQFLKKLGFALLIEENIVGIFGLPIELSPLEVFRRGCKTLDTALKLDREGYGTEVRAILLYVVQNPDGMIMGDMETAVAFFTEKQEWQSVVLVGSAAVNFFRRYPEVTSPELGAAPHVAGIYAQLGQAYYELGNPKEAERVLDEGFAAYPQWGFAFIAPYFLLAEGHAVYGKCLAVFNALAPNIVPESKPAFNFKRLQLRLCQSLAKGISAGEAQALTAEFEQFTACNNAVIVEQNIPVHTTYAMVAWAYLQIQNPAAARRFLEKAVPEVKTASFTYKGLNACVLNAEGKKDEARATAKEAMALTAQGFNRKKVAALYQAVREIAEEKPVVIASIKPPPKPAPAVVPGGLDETTFLRSVIFRGTDWEGYYGAFTRTRHILEGLIGKLGDLGSGYSALLAEETIYDKAPQFFGRETTLAFAAESKLGKALHSLGIASITLVWEDEKLKVRIYPDERLHISRRKTTLYFEGSVSKEARVELTANHNVNLRLAGLLLEAFVLERVFCVLCEATENQVETALPKVFA